MIGSFILGIIAGWGAPRLEPLLTEQVKQRLGEDAKPDALEARGLALTIAILLAAILAALMGRAETVPLALGAVVGVALPRIRQFWTASRTPDYDS